MSGLTRRRFMVIAAAAFAARQGVEMADQPPPALWRGIALGARAEIRIDGYDGEDAADIIALARREIDRLENLFSLYRTNSAIARLNRTGVLAEPDPDFLALLSIAASVHRATDGCFDPTVQPLWDAYARLYAEGTGGHNAEDALVAISEQTSERVGFDGVRFGPDRIAFQRPGMALTLNGIAQGYITDRIADLMLAQGLRHVLVDVGELRALDGRRDGRGWPVRIAGAGEGETAKRVVLQNNRALATSATLGTTFDAAGRIGHILDPRGGKPISRRLQVTVEAPTAAVADALSTAFCLMSEKAAVAALSAFPDALVHVMG